LLELMAEMWLGDSGVLEFVMVDAGSGVELVSSGQADLLIGGVAHSRDAELELDFALTTYVSGESLLVEAGTAIQGLEGLQGMQVGSASDGTSGDTLLSLANQAGVQLTVLAYPSLDDAIEALRAEEIAAIVADRSDLLYTADNTAGLEVLDWRLTEVPIALGLPPGDSAFRDLVNLTLQSLAADGTLEALYTIWFDDEPLEVRAWPGTAYRSLLLETADELE
jgi:ABC-type amino acid transport substrate-binding protein